MNLDTEKAGFFLMLHSLDVLSGREMKYLMWRFALNKENKEIAALDNKNITSQAVQFIIKGGIEKIRRKCLKDKVFRDNLLLNYA